MRDAESILDQLLSGDAGPLTADAVRDLLGLADGDSVATFVTALATGEPVAGIALLDGLEERGRDLRSFTDQAVDALRVALRGSLAGVAGAGSVRGLDTPRLSPPHGASPRSTRRAPLPAASASSWSWRSSRLPLRLHPR